MQLLEKSQCIKSDIKNFFLDKSALEKQVLLRECQLYGYLGSCSIVGQSLRCVQLSVTPWTATRQASPFFTISQSLLNTRPLNQ